MLHLVAFSAQRHDLLANLLTCVSEGDQLVLLEDGCYLAGRAGQPLFDQLPAHCQVAIIEKDARARAVEITQPATPIDHDGLVTLSEQQQASLSWY